MSEKNFSGNSTMFTCCNTGSVWNNAYLYFIETVHVDPISDLFHVITTLVLSVICLTIDFAKVHINNDEE